MPEESISLNRQETTSLKIGSTRLDLRRCYPNRISISCYLLIFMVSDMELLSSVPFSIGFLGLVIGYMIRRRQGLIVVGARPTAPSNPRGFCYWVGTHLVILGIVSVFCGMLVLFFSQAGVAVMLSYAFLIVVFTASSALGVTRFESPRLERKT